METDWSVAAGADDPVIEAHWSDAASGLRWLDLRVDDETQRSSNSVRSRIRAVFDRGQVKKVLFDSHISSRS